MHRESLALTILRYLFTFGLFAFMAMLYWSSALLERDMKEVQSSLSRIGRDLESLKSHGVSLGPATSSFARPLGRSLQHVDEAFPNLLVADPFYDTTLPGLLGKDFVPSGTLHGSSIGRPDNLHPFNQWAHISAWTSQCSLTVARNTFGKYESYSPYAALKVEERRDPQTKIPEYWIHLRDDLFWEPLRPSSAPRGVVLAPVFMEKHPVTAHDFKFFYDAVMNPHVQEPQAVTLRMFLRDIEEFRVIDDHTFVVRWRTKEILQPDGQKLPMPDYVAFSHTVSLRPLPRFVFQHFADGSKIVEEDEDPNIYRSHSIWAQNFSRHWASQVIISCGPWIFDGMGDKEIHFRRNRDFFDPYANLVEKMVVDFKESFDSIWQSFKAGVFDTHTVQPELLREYEEFILSPQYRNQVKNNLAIERLDYVARSYYYIGWNQARPFFQSTKVRQAMTIAIDRQRIIDQILHGMGVQMTGPFFPFSEATDPLIVPFPYDPIRARFLLQEEGWYDHDADGILDKEIDGERVPFQFSLTYYVKNPTTKAICEYISTALKEIGVDCRLRGVELSDLSATFDDKNFDAVALGWALGTPPEDPRQLWYSAGAKQKGSSNAVGFSNAEADAIINALQFEYNREKRIALYHRFNQIIYEEQPYTFLYAPKVAYLFREYLQNVFLPVERQDLVPGADVQEPQTQIYWIKNERENAG